MVNFSAEPLALLAVDYDVVGISWQVPSGSYDRLRLIRNQAHYAEHQEDGIILVDTLGSDTSYTRFIDGEDTPFQSGGLKPGAFTYYSIWLRKTSDYSWVEAAKNNCLIPKDHGDMLMYNNASVSDSTTHNKVMELLPRVFTSTNLSPLDEVDPDSDLYKFLYAFSFTVDEILTYADLAVPNVDIANTAPSMLETRLQHLGIDFAGSLPDSSKKALLRDALFMYSNKGTVAGLTTFVEAMTGFSTVTTPSVNLMPSIESATFNGGEDSTNSFDLGGWTSKNCDIDYDYSTDIPNQEAVSQRFPGRAEVVVPAGRGGSITQAYRSAGSGVVTIYTTGAQTLRVGDQVYVSSSESTITGTWWVVGSSSSVLAVLTDTTTALSLSSPSGSWYSTDASIDLFSLRSIELYTSSTDSAFINTCAVKPGEDYVATCYAKTSTSSRSIKPTITWFSTKGEVIGTTQVGTGESVGSDWTLITGDTFTAPSYNEVWTSSLTSTDESGQTKYVFTVEAGHGLIVGQVLLLEGLPSGDGEYTITAVTSTSVTAKGGTALGASTSATGWDSQLVPKYEVAYASVGFEFSGSGTYYLDLVQLATASNSGDGYNEPNGVYVYLAPNKINYLKNPSFELKTAAWSTTSTAVDNWLFGNVGSAATQVTDSPQFILGTKSCEKSVASGALFGISSTISSGISAGQWYTFSIYLKTTSSTPATNFVIYATATDSSGPTVTTVTSAAITLTSTWTRHSVSIFVPDDYAEATTTLAVGVKTNGNANATTTVRLDAAQVEDGFKMTDYFDGSYSSIGAAWENALTSNNSRSYWYVNKKNKLRALEDRIAEFIPRNVPYAVSSMAGTEFQGTA